MSHATINGRLFDANDFVGLEDAMPTTATANTLVLVAPATPSSPTVTFTFGGSLAYTHEGVLFAGTINSFSLMVGQQTIIAIDSFSLPVGQGLAWLEAGDVNSLVNYLFGGPDTIDGSGMLQGFAGNDMLNVLGTGATSVLGGLGDDVVTVAAGGSNYLRGDEGNDSITGGAGFDDINGNMGNDTAHGGLGGDWVVGGKDLDVLSGDAGDDIVYGNLGADTCDGGDGDDIVRGGQQDDIVTGGAGADWLSGDRDSDTITGGAGADIFHTFGGAGVDRVTDFSVAEGDRVQLDPGTEYTLAQVGADTVISMTGGGQMVLVGVQMSTLPDGWIFGA